MKKHLMNLKPDRFEDLVAMNALYRPGPMEYIPSFIDRKHGREKVEYDHPLMEPYLKDTYGITVYQEQVMLQSRALGGFTRGDSDTLRKAMGKKIMAMMDKLKLKFVDGCQANEDFVKGCEENKKEPVELIEKIWKDWEAFASYAFNKSHSVCYAYVAYQTGYLKAHFPAEFMAANLSRNLSNIADVTKLMEECKRMHLKVFGPDVNMSYRKFTVDRNGDIRFGMAAIKGVGEAAVDSIIKEREENGLYKDIYDFVERVDLRTVNKKTLESLIQAGAFDEFSDVKHRAQFFAPDDRHDTFLESLVRYGVALKDDRSNTQNTLFGDMNSGEVAIAKPQLPDSEPWSNIERLNREKELVGIYLSAHPLDDFKLELTQFCNGTLSMLEDLNAHKGKDLTVGGMISSCAELKTKNGNPYGIMTIEDFSGTYTHRFFGKTYLEFRKYMIQGLQISMKGRVEERRWGNSDELEFNVLSIGLLREMREKLLNSITLKLSIEQLDTKLLEEIVHEVEENKGPVTLKFLLFNPKDKVWIQMYSRKYRVDVNNQFLDYLDNNPNVDYKID
jgi:DNA polymerase-3 subunit alpha